MPDDVAPMMAVSAARLPPDSPDWSFEFKWDGVRTIAYVRGGRLRLCSRNRLDITSRYPELAPMGRALRGHAAVLDGEIVGLDGQGRPSFRAIQQRIHAVSAAARRRAAGIRVVFMLFDLLHLDGRDLMPQPLSTRRRELERLNLRGASWQTPPAHRAEGEAMLEAARRTQLEGVIAKRVDSPYLPGVRSDLWRKVKLLNRQEFVIGGWLPMQGTDDVGSLLVGYYGDQGAALRYAGKVGTGFDAAERARLKRLFEQRRRRSSPFAGVVRGAGVRGARFVEPDLVAEVEFYEWTHDNRLRQPSYKGLRADKRALDVRREPAAALMDSPMRKR